MNHQTLRFFLFYQTLLHTKIFSYLVYHMCIYNRIRLHTHHTQTRNSNLWITQRFIVIAKISKKGDLCSAVKNSDSGWLYLLRHFWSQVEFRIRVEPRHVLSQHSIQELHPYPRYLVNRIHFISQFKQFVYTYTAIKLFSVLLSSIFRISSLILSKSDYKEFCLAFYSDYIYI